VFSRYVFGGALGRVAHRDDGRFSRSLGTVTVGLLDTSVFIARETGRRSV